MATWKGVPGRRRFERTSLTGAGEGSSIFLAIDILLAAQHRPFGMEISGQAGADVPVGWVMP
jgi:hypothetical protein